jgi:hypothetical protein
MNRADDEVRRLRRYGNWWQRDASKGEGSFQQKWTQGGTKRISAPFIGPEGDGRWADWRSTDTGECFFNVFHEWGGEMTGWH